MSGPNPSQIPSGLLTSTGTGNGHTLDDTAILPANTTHLHFRVTAAGSLRFEDAQGSTMDLTFDAGTYVYPFKSLKRVHSTGSSATLNPTGTVFPLGYKAKP